MSKQLSGGAELREEVVRLRLPVLQLTVEPMAMQRENKPLTEKQFYPISLSVLPQQEVQ